MGQGLQSVIEGKKDVSSLKELLPYSDITNPQYIGIAIVDGENLEGLSFKGISPDSDDIEFYFSPKDFQLKLFRTTSKGASKSYTNETGQWVEVKEDLQSEYKYFFSEYSDEKPAVEIGGKVLEINK